MLETVWLLIRIFQGVQGYKVFCVQSSQMSLNHRIIETGRNWEDGKDLLLWRSSGSTPFYKQGHLEPLARVYVQIAAEEADSTNSTAQHSTAQQCFLVFKWKLLCSSMCPLPLVLTLSITAKSLTPFSLHPSLGIYRHWWDPLSLIFYRLSIPSSLSLSWQEGYSCPFIILMALCWTLSNMFLSVLPWEAQNWRATRVSHQLWAVGETLLFLPWWKLSNGYFASTFSVTSVKINLGGVLLSSPI